MKSERWYWLPVFLALSFGIHLGIALLNRGAGGKGAGGKTPEIEVTLIPRGELTAMRLPGRPGKSLAQRPAKFVGVPQPFSPPELQARTSTAKTIRQPDAVTRIAGPAPATVKSGAAAGAPPTGLAQTRVALPLGAPGSGQNGIMGGGGPAQRVLKVSMGEDPARAVTISSTDTSAVRRRPAPVRARPRYESSAPPVYPEEARLQNQKGTVYLKVAVTAEGKPESVELLFSSGFPLLDDAAITAVREWSFDPAHTEAGPFRSVISVPVPFPPN